VKERTKYLTGRENATTNARMASNKADPFVDFLARIVLMLIRTLFANFQNIMRGQLTSLQLIVMMLIQRDAMRLELNGSLNVRIITMVMELTVTPDALREWK